MAEKKITRKVISKRATDLEEESVKPVVEESSKETKPKRGCLFCQSKSTPTYTDLVNLRRFLTDRAKILPRSRSGICSRHQRAIAKNIKYARHLALLPFVPKV